LKKPDAIEKPLIKTTRQYGCHFI